MDINTLLLELTKKEGSDLHLKVGAPPIMRKKRKLCALGPQFPIIDYHKIDQLILPLLNDNQQEHLRNHGSVDAGYGLKGVGRFRFNVLFQRGSLRVVIRRIPHLIPSVEELGLPKKLLSVVDKTERGLILVAGATGVGKSTTLASIINYINKTKNKHIVTIEDPIEFLIQDHHSLITQREMGVDCYDPNIAFKAALRQDPDIILFSELRLRDTISTALTAAETGHLVLSTIHVKEAGEAVPRIVNLFPHEEQTAIKMLIASTLKAVFAQRLVPRKDGAGYIPAVEIMLNNFRIQKEIESDAPVDKIRGIIKQSKSHWGMQTFDQHLVDLLKAGLVSQTDAVRYSSSPEKIKLVASGISYENQYNTQQKQPSSSAPKSTTPPSTSTSSKIDLKQTQTQNITLRRKDSA